MARRTRQGDPNELRRRLIDLLNDFEQRLNEDDLREQVRALVPVLHTFRDLGSSLILKNVASSGMERILHYLCRYPLTAIASDELAVVSGTAQYARRTRQLRVEFGWPIYSGTTVKQMFEEELTSKTEEFLGSGLPLETIESMKVDDYILVGDQDRDAAHRWHIANRIRKMTDLSIRDRLLFYLRENVEKPVTGEELRYVAKGKRSWPRRTRELRTQEGWSVLTRNTGRPDLPVGMYVLEHDRQLPPHDREIPDRVRVIVLERDDFRCRCCGWSQSKRQAGDPRTLLELHHIKHAITRGSSEPENLITLCNVDHDEVHRLKLNGKDVFAKWLESNCN